MADITVPIPDERVAEFYQFFGLWLAKSLSLSASLPAGISGAADPSKPLAVVAWARPNGTLPTPRLSGGSTP